LNREVGTDTGTVIVVRREAKSTGHAECVGRAAPVRTGRKNEDADRFRQLDCARPPNNSLHSLYDLIFLVHVKILTLKAAART
jgi:hypothetical protein